MKMPMNNSARSIVAGLGALILAGTLSACGAKDKGAQNETAANVSAAVPTPTDNASTSADRERDQAANIAADMEKHHRQEMDRRDMRQGSPMSSPPSDASSNGQMSPMKDM